MDKKVLFYSDLEIIYEYTDRKTILKYKLFGFLDKSCKERQFLDDFLIENNLEINKESLYAIAAKVVFLKEDSLVQYLKKEKIDEKKIEVVLENAYEFVKNISEKEFMNLIDFIEERKLLSEFYRELIKGHYKIGLEFDKWLPLWKKHIINTINKNILKEFNADEKKVFEYLRKNNLFDKGHNEEQADRSYSVLVKTKTGYEVKANAEFFENNVKSIVCELENLNLSLQKLEDNIFNQKKEYLDYTQSLITAFKEKDRNKLIKNWSIVDEKWMQIKTPIQMSHPLEYYDDHFRKAVQLEWDIRINNPNYAKNERSQKIKQMYKTLYAKIDKDKNYKNKYKHVYDMCTSNIDRTQIYIGKPIFYYGSELNGLFSAQVVPNDTIASKKCGKKIFAFADNVLLGQQNKPFMKLPCVIYEKEFVKKLRRFYMKQTKSWHKIYDIETIGHEFGHILWLDEDTEIHMNKNGNFKNIEEFKATSGGLVSYFIDEKNENLDKEVVEQLISRAVGLIAWMEVGDVLPYYCEGLIHLSALFDSNIIEFNGNKITVRITEENYNKLKEWYLKTYEELAINYLEKKNADEFLYTYMKKEENVFLPKDEKIRKFVLWYYEQYKIYANTIDDEDKKENYL